MAEPTDGELLMRFSRHQDEQAFETLVRRHQASIFGVCYRVLGNSHDAEDAFQAKFLVLARKAKRFQTASSIGGWLFRVALRTAKNARVKKWRSKEEALNVTVSSESEPLAIIQQQELVTTLYEELAKLPQKYQTPLVLCILEGKSRLEASTELECTVASLKARLARGRQQLRVNLTRRGVAFSVALTAACTSVSVADAAISSLCSTTTAACSSFVFAAESCNVSPDIVQLSEKGMSAMTLATYSKLAIASIVLLSVGLGSATLPVPGPSNAHAADSVVDIELGPIKVAQRANTFTTARQPVTATILPPAGSKALPAPVVGTITTAGQTTARWYGNGGTGSAAPRVSKEASNEVVEALIEALGDNEQEVTHNAAKTLISIGKGHSKVVARLPSSQLAPKTSRFDTSRS